MRYELDNQPDSKQPPKKPSQFYLNINTDEQLKVTESWLAKFKNTVQVIDVDLKDEKLTIAQVSILQSQKQRYESRIAELEYDINAYKSYVNKPQDFCSFADFWGFED